jgi:hypothetical protein
LFLGGTAEVKQELLSPPEVVRVQLTDFDGKKARLGVVFTRQEVEPPVHALGNGQSLIDAPDRCAENWNRRG